MNHLLSMMNHRRKTPLHYKKIMLVIGLLLAFINIGQAQELNFGWLQGIGGTSSDGGNRVTTDAAGNVYLAADINSTSLVVGEGTDTVTVNNQVHLLGYYYGSLNFGTGAQSSGTSPRVFLAKYDNEFAGLWMTLPGGTGQDDAYELVLDEQNNSYITGYHSKTANFNPNGTIADRTSRGHFEAFLASYDTEGIMRFAHSFGSTGDDRSHGVHLNTNGDVYVTGHFSNTVDFAYSGAVHQLTSKGTSNIYLVKYAATEINLKANNQNIASGDTLDLGNVVQQGSSQEFTFTIENMGGGLLNLSGTPVVALSGTHASRFTVTQDSIASSIGEGANTTFTVRFNANDLGNRNTMLSIVNNDADESVYTIQLKATAIAPNWTKGIGGTGNDGGNRVATDAAGNVYLAADISSTSLVVGEGADTVTVNNPAGTHAILLTKYRPNGTPIWAKSITGGNITINDMQLDASGNIYLTGFYASGTTDFDPDHQAGSAVLTSTAAKSMFVARYSTANGQYEWVTDRENSEGFGLAIDASNNVYVSGDKDGSTFVSKYDSANQLVWDFIINGSSSGKGIALDAASNVYIAGHLLGGATDFDPDLAGTANLSIANGNVFIAKYNSNGQYQNAVATAKNGFLHNMKLSDIAVDNNNNVHILGYFNGYLDFGNGLHHTGGVPYVFLAKYDASFNNLWMNQIGGSGQDDAYGLALDAQNNSYITGYHSNTANFNPKTGQAKGTLRLL